MSTIKVAISFEGFLRARHCAKNITRGHLTIRGKKNHTRKVVFVVIVIFFFSFFNEEDTEVERLSYSPKVTQFPSSWTTGNTLVSIWLQPWNVNSFVSMTLCLHALSLSHGGLCDPMDCSPPHSSAHGIFQARILERVPIFSSRESSWPRDWTHVSCVSGSPALAGKFFTSEPPRKPLQWLFKRLIIFFVKSFVKFYSKTC